MIEYSLNVIFKLILDGYEILMVIVIVMVVSGQKEEM